MRRFSPFQPFTEAASIANLERRVRMQRDALAQAERDLAAAQDREDDEDIEEGSPGAVADPARLARLVVAADEKRRGLRAIEPTNVRVPTVRVTADEVLAAAAKADKLGRKP